MISTPRHAALISRQSSGLTSDSDRLTAVASCIPHTNSTGESWYYVYVVQRPVPVSSTVIRNMVNLLSKRFWSYFRGPLLMGWKIHVINLSLITHRLQGDCPTCQRYGQLTKGYNPHGMFYNFLLWTGIFTQGYPLVWFTCHPSQNPNIETHR